MNVQLPKEVKVGNTIARFSAHYELSGGKIHAARIFQTNVLEVPPES